MAVLKNTLTDDEATAPDELAPVKPKVAKVPATPSVTSRSSGTARSAG